MDTNELGTESTPHIYDLGTLLEGLEDIKKYPRREYLQIKNKLIDEALIVALSDNVVWERNLYNRLDNEYNSIITAKNFKGEDVQLDVVIYSTEQGIFLHLFNNSIGPCMNDFDERVKSLWQRLNS